MILREILQRRYGWVAYIDIVASLYGRSKLTEIVKNAAKDVFVPMTVGGGARSIDDVRDLLRAGADKVAISTAAVENPNLIRDVSRILGLNVVYHLKQKNNQIQFGRFILILVEKNKYKCHRLGKTSWRTGAGRYFLHL